jgi:hypothetical protein
LIFGSLIFGVFGLDRFWLWDMLPEHQVSERIETNGSPKHYGLHPSLHRVKLCAFPSLSIAKRLSGAQAFYIVLLTTIVLCEFLGAHTFLMPLHMSV